MRTSFSSTALDRISEMRANGVTLAILAKQYQTTRCVMTRIIQELNPGQVSARGRQLGRSFKERQPRTKFKKAKQLYDYPNGKPQGNPVPIISAGLNCCRDVVGKELFCGAPVARGSFCAAHAEKYYLPKKQKLED